MHQGVLQNTLQHPLTILPQAKWSPRAGFIHSHIARSTQKWPQAGNFSLFPAKFTNGLFKLCRFDTAP
jgi:hypothetical protein